MMNTVYRLVAPRRFETEFSDIDLMQDKIVVRPTYLSICHADQRYYQGERPPEILAKKLPMALIHEGIGRIMYDPTGEYVVGEEVVMIPNTPTESDDVIAENYLRSSKFRASGFDGFLQDYVVMDSDRLVRLPKGINKTVAAFTELVSVSMHCIRRFERFSHSRREVVGIWGDGNLGFITAVLFKTMFPEIKLCIFGINKSKLNDFSFADETFITTSIPKDLKIDHAFECVGGNGSHVAINQIIDYINPEGTIAILGVSEYPAPINTRMVLEKGLRIYGSSRSGREDYLKLMELYSKHPDIINYFENIIGSEVKVRTLKDITNAFETDIKNGFGKTVMVWEK